VYVVFFTVHWNKLLKLINGFLHKMLVYRKLSKKFQASF